MTDLTFKTETEMKMHIARDEVLMVLNDSFDADETYVVTRDKISRAYKTWISSRAIVKGEECYEVFYHTFDSLEGALMYAQTTAFATYLRDDSQDEHRLCTRYAALLMRSVHAHLRANNRRETDVISYLA